MYSDCDIIDVVQEATSWAGTAYPAEDQAEGLQRLLFVDIASFGSSTFQGWAYWCSADHGLDRTINEEMLKGKMESLEENS